MKKIFSAKLAENVLTSLRVISFTLVALFFTNLVFFLPIGVTIWAMWLSLSVASILLMLSLFFALLDMMIIQSFLPAKWFAALALTGLGILLSLTSYYVLKFLLKGTRSYINWNIRTLIGGD